MIRSILASMGRALWPPPGEFDHLSLADLAAEAAHTLARCGEFNWRRHRHEAVVREIVRRVC